MSSTVDTTEPGCGSEERSKEKTKSYCRRVKIGTIAQKELRNGTDKMVSSNLQVTGVTAGRKERGRGNDCRDNGRCISRKNSCRRVSIWFVYSRRLGNVDFGSWQIWAWSWFHHFQLEILGKYVKPWFPHLPIYLPQEVWQLTQRRLHHREWLLLAVTITVRGEHVTDLSDTVELMWELRWRCGFPHFRSWSVVLLFHELLP